MKKISFLFPIIFLLFLSLPVFAHQPNYVAREKNIQITEPEISKAYYGELSGEEVIYTINSESDFELYLGLLAPDIPDIEKNYSIIVFNSDNKEIANLNGETFEWTKFYEEFAGDWYWKGPEFKERVVKGNYTINIHNPKNLGKYVLVVGEKESFPLRKMLTTFEQLIQVKVNSFDKPWYTAFTNKIGLFTFLPLAVILLITISIILLFKRKFSQKKSIT